MIASFHHACTALWRGCAKGVQSHDMDSLEALQYCEYLSPLSASRGEAASITSVASQYLALASPAWPNCGWFVRDENPCCVLRKHDPLAAKEPTAVRCRPGSTCVLEIHILGVKLRLALSTCAHPRPSRQICGEIITHICCLIALTNVEIGNIIVDTVILPISINRCSIL